MIKTLLIQFHPDKQVDCLLLDEKNQLIHESPLSLESLDTTQKHINTLVIVPTQEIVLRQVTLPALKKRDALQALPYALEEELTSAPETLHFAIGDYQKHQPTHVAIVARNTMETWLSILKEHNIQPTLMIPDVFLLPFEEGSSTLYTTELTTLLRTGLFEGIGLDPNTFETLLPLLPHQPIKKITTPFNTLCVDFMNRLKTTPYISLLQQDYAPKLVRSSKPVWHFVLAGIASLSLLLLAGELMSVFILSIKSWSIEKHIQLVSKNHLPKEPEIKLPEERLTSHLHTVSHSLYQHHFLILLSSIGKAFTESGSLRLRSLQFNQNQVTLSVAGTHPEHLDHFIEKLTSNGLTVSESSHTTLGTQFNATLLISTGAT